MSEVAEQQDQASEKRNDAVFDANKGVTLKDSAIDKDKQEETREERMKRLNMSDLPGHTYETEQIAKSRQEEIANKGDQDYKFEANGYTVTETKGVNLLAMSEEDKNKLYKVTAKDYERTFTSKRDAEIFVTTHAIEFTGMPATFPSN